MNKIISLRGTFTKTLLLEDNSLWFSSEKFTDEISLKARINRDTDKYLNNDAKVNYSSIKKVEMNEGSNKIKLCYIGKETEVVYFVFESRALAHKIGEFIAANTSLKRSIKREGTLKKIFYNNNGFWVLGVILITILAYFKFFMTGFYEKGKLYKILTFLHDSIGANGILFIGVAITSYFVINIFRRFLIKVNDIIFE